MPTVLPRRPADRCRAGDDDDDGFTLLEVVVSFVLFAIVAGAATMGIVNSMKAAHTSQQRVDAANVAQHFVTQARSDTAEVTRRATSTQTVSVGNERFAVERTIAFDSGATRCGDGVTFVVHVLVSNAVNEQFLARSDARVLC
ncbi:MAG TPA: type II secretion system protein [Jatrophihabitans sp.]|nr:type II secretion system protein [Jatrophihabitans sp.]